jgi:hypothetical protein
VLIFFILLTIVGVATAAFCCGIKFAGPKRPQIESIDYKERWIAAVELLGDQGQLTSEQVKSISAVQKKIRPEPPKSSGAVLDRRGRPGSGPYAGMASWDRLEVQKARAKAGLPDDDDLEGMASWDKADVLKTRAKYANVK